MSAQKTDTSGGFRKAKDLRWAGDDVNEFGYFPENYKSQLTDIYNKAHSKKEI